MTDKYLLSPEAAAKALSLSRSSIYVEMSSGRLESIHVGRARRIPVDAIERWLQDRRAAANPIAA